ncbi:DUF3604 domain-containing protein [Parerythrobacter lacustris]|uniref:DUF3604 domain-containing protein n=1 Tax=Parerythrobacter lacustris TaxID=2969984 RepID=A0ABT1XLS4_9SPHN|nr:DUF3604 domain-containing protein [Parerythrobacter lacustris]MCR2832608.1 DUF3604 domain-containing protein [Parerythrobacter lacustris]
MKRILGIGLLVLAVAAGGWWLFLRDDPEGVAAKLAEAEAAVPLTDYPERVYWGDTHLHTSISFDAYGFGNRLGAEDALRFAMGEEVTSTTGIKAKLARPLDFLVISDHSDGMGALQRLAEAPRLLLSDPTMQKWHDMLNESPQQSLRATSEIIAAAAAGTLPDQMLNSDSDGPTRDLWTEHLAIIDRYDRPGTFTALAGFEYSLLPEGNNLHRVVMFRDGYDRTTQVLPFPSLETKVEDLWAYMEGYEKKTGGQVLAMPHNSNVSNGLMFETTMSDGSPMTAEYARRRARHEPVVEATQIKGDSEAHPFLSPNDEFAGFGKSGWSIGNLDASHPATDAMQGGNYIREALKRGLSLEQQLGVNPYAFGLIGSTDSHTSLATGDEDNFFGKHTGNEPSAKDRANAPQNLGTRQGRFGWNYLAGGYAAAWARGNTRAEIFDAFKRREVYATTGPRMVVRVFGGFGFTPDMFEGDWVKAGYSRGVPMGGNLADEGKAPSFLISALKDPDGAHLDRVQVVKGWVNPDGTTGEKVYDVVWSDMDKRAMAGGKVPLVGDTVDRAKATYTNTIGAPELRSVWTDPDYRAGQSAFYYVRVLEIPTPRWTLFDAVRFGIKLSADALADGVAQERAYTSPIWLGPAKAPKPATQG